MIDSCFVLCPGVGPATETRLWSRGVRTWADFLELGEEAPVSRGARAIVQPFLEECITRLAARDVVWLAKHLPAREHWRAYPRFGGGARFLDIETTGGGPDDAVTVVGVLGPDGMRQYVRHENMRDFRDEIGEPELVVTFAGTSFDLPMIRHHLGWEHKGFHIDLCYLFRRLGHKGGLKAIEPRFGIERGPASAGLSGFDAVRLWWEWENRDRRASLDQLLAYNAEDVVNLKTLMEIAMPMVTAMSSVAGDA